MNLPEFRFAAAGIIGLVALLLPSLAADAKLGADCTFNGKRLWGKVQIVTSFPDIKVQHVNSIPDLNVQVVTSFPDRCGKWQYVNSFPDLKVQFVSSFSDVKVKFVTSFPGLP